MSAIDTSFEVTAHATFMDSVSRCVSEIKVLADTLHDKPGAAEVLRTVAERYEGQALDLLARWPA